MRYENRDHQTIFGEKIMNRHPKLCRRLLWIIAATLILACKLGNPLGPSDADTCGQSRKPTEKDVNFLLEFTGDTFASEDWQKSNSVEDLRATVTWVNSFEGGLAYAEYLLYNCGYTQDDVEQYFSDDNFRNIIFSEYQNVEPIAACIAEKEALTHYEFNAVWKDEKYTLRYWIKKDNQTRILTLLLAFPESSTILMDQYAEAIFPTLPSCQK